MQTDSWQSCSTALTGSSSDVTLDLVTVTVPVLPREYISIADNWDPRIVRILSAGIDEEIEEGVGEGQSSIAESDDTEVQKQRQEVYNQQRNRRHKIDKCSGFRRGQTSTIHFMKFKIKSKGLILPDTAPLHLLLSYSSLDSYLILVMRTISQSYLLNSSLLFYLLGIQQPAARTPNQPACCTSADGSVRESANQDKG